jgi:hypothetical protein
MSHPAQSDLTRSPCQICLPEFSVASRFCTFDARPESNHSPIVLSPLSRPPQRSCRVMFRRDYGRRVVSTIREQHRLRKQRAEQSRTQPIVVRFAWREREMDWQAIGVRHRVNLARQARARQRRLRRTDQRSFRDPKTNCCLPRSELSNVVMSLILPVRKPLPTRTSAAYLWRRYSDGLPGCGRLHRSWGRRLRRVMPRRPNDQGAMSACLQDEALAHRRSRGHQTQARHEKNVVAPDDQDQTPQSAVMQPTAPAIPEPGEREIEPSNLQPTPPIELPPDSLAPPDRRHCALLLPGHRPPHDIPWQIAVGNDLQHPGVQGKRPAPLRFFNWHIARLFRAAQTDVVLTTRFLEMVNLMRQPAALLEPRTALRVWSAMA